MKGNSLATGNTKDDEIVVLLEYFSNCWRVLEIVLIDCKIDLILTWSENSAATGATTSTECDFIVLSQVNEILLTVNKFH